MEITVDDLCEKCKERLAESKSAGEELYYHFIMFGSEGCEGYRVVEDPEEISGSAIESMRLRARFNSHRDVKVYAFSLGQKIPMKAITKELLEKDGILRLY